jgi:hypothetical protein
LAFDAFTRLGFFVSPPLLNAQQGTQTRFLTFGSDHVELVAAEENGVSRDFSQILGAAQGKMIGAGLGSRDIQASYGSLCRSGLDIQPAINQSCLLVGSEGTENCACSTVALPEGQPPGLPAFLCQHPKFEIVRRREWQNHPNTAQGIVSLTVLLDNPEAAIPGYNRIFGPAASTPTDDTVTVHTGHGLIFLVNANGFDDLHPCLDVRLLSPPLMAVLTIGVADIAKTAAILAANGIVSKLWGGHLGIPAQDILGIGLEFVQL